MAHPTAPLPAAPAVRPAPSDEVVVRAVGLTKVFKDFWGRPKARAVDNVDFEIRRGEIFGLLGPNGSGKSTTIKMLLGLLYPTKGHITVFNQSPRDVRTKARIGYLPEESYLYRYLNPGETLDFFGSLFQLDSSDRRNRTEQLIEMVGLNQARSRTVGEFSKGMQRRIGIAQALVNDPDLIILDEPTAGLDPNQIVEIRNLIKDLGKEKTVILSTHILSEVQSTCSRVLIINEGRLVADDTPEHLTAQADGSGVVTVVLGHRHGQPLDAATIRASLSAMAGVIGVDEAEGEGSGTLGFRIRHGADDVRRTLFETVVKNDLMLLEVRRTQVSLEETFRKLTDTRRAA
jgi:ABC-2 type transport system ATP-binding protein